MSDEKLAPKPATNTVADLMVKLSKLDPNAIVVLEGCDCEGEWNGEMRFSTSDDREMPLGCADSDAKRILLCR